MGQHDEYGKAVLREAIGGSFSSFSRSCSYSYCAGCSAHIDGVIGDTIAVEIESRVPKQIRGAMMDLICHPHPQKLLVLLPAYVGNPETVVGHCEVILGRFLAEGAYRVVLLSGHGDHPAKHEDVRRVRRALEGWIFDVKSCAATQ